MSVMPAGWTTTTLGDVALEVRNGISTKPNEDSGLPILRISAVRAMKLDASDVRYLPADFPNAGTYALRTDDLLFTRYNGNRDLVGACARAAAVAAGLTYPDKLIRVRLDTRVALPAFVEAAACAQGARDFIDQQLKTSAGQVGVSGADLKRLPLPLAPLAEQQRIADKLDAVVARVDACRDRLARVASLLKRFRQAVLSAATSGRLSADWRDLRSEASATTPARSPLVIYADEQDELPAGWSWRQLVELARLESGHTPRKSVAAYWDGGDVPWISLQDIRAADGRVVTETKFRPTQAGIDNSSARLLPEGTVCFCRDISFGYVTIMGRPMATSQHFANWVCTPQLLPKYLMYAFMAARRFLGMSGQGTTVTTIYMPALKELRLATPTAEEQAEIVRRVGLLFAFADRLEARLAKAQAAADRLTPALLAKAFRGELVPQDPADEPAAELLKRLTADGPAPAAKVRRPRAV